MRLELPVLIKARALIADPAKWGKGTRGYGPERRPLDTCCAAEAIEDSEPVGARRRAAIEALYRALELNWPAITLPNWNDHAYPV